MTGMEAPPVIVLPDPCLVVLVGAAGSGKSTFAARHFAPSEVLSSDAFRERISGDPADQAATGAAFAALHAALSKRLRERLLTVVDATSVQAHARRQLTRRAAEADVPAIANVLDLPLTVVIERNAARSGLVVPEAAVRRQLAELDRTLRTGRLETERFASVVRLGNVAAVDSARFARAR